jgi:hypothetical protein
MDNRMMYGDTCQLLLRSEMRQMREDYLEGGCTRSLNV